jgi:hypothetical protein
MSRSSNTIHTSDISITPIKLKYLTTYNSSSISQAGISVFSGSNGTISLSGGIPQSTLNYYSIKQLYYSNYLTGSFLTTTSSFDNSLQSTAASGTLEADVRIFPTALNASIKGLSIPRSVFGQRISPKTFAITSSLYTIVDDGNGNLVDLFYDTDTYISGGYFNPDLYYEATSSILAGAHVGNILYAQGMVIITNPDYQNLF